MQKALNVGTALSMTMALKYSDEELEETRRYLKKLRDDPAEYEKWLDRVVKGWLKRKYGKSYRTSRKG